MIASPQRQYMSPEEYLAWEPLQENRFEYIDGKVLLREGETKPHNRITGNLAIALNRHLAGRCEVYISDVKVQVSEGGSYLYPDVVVSCDELDRHTD